MIEVGSSRQTLRLRSPHVALGCAIGLAWVVAVAAEVGGRAEDVHHDALLEGGLGVPAALGLFAAGWVVMLAAMMLPSALPLVVMFHRASAGQARRTLVRAAFLGGYAGVWLAFGLAAFAADAALHAAVDGSAWLSRNEHVIAGGVLVTAGAFQFSPLKDACLDSCRHPAAWLLHHYRRGVGAAFSMGRRHGTFCLGCCWALMAVSFAVGVANLAWMGVLAAAMTYEKAGRSGHRAVVPIGAALLLLGSAVLLVPDAVPSWLGLVA